LIGIEATVRIKQTYPHVAVAMLSKVAGIAQLSDEIILSPFASGLLDRTMTR